MKSSALPYWLTLFVLLGIAYGGWKAWQIEQARQQHQQAFSTDAKHAGPPLTEFTLTERSGEPFHSRDLKGKVWAASYFFTECPGPCKQMNEGIASLASLDELAEVRFVSITCDPNTDTPERLADYAERFRADPDRWLFCTGDMDYLQRVGNDILKFSIKPKGHNQNLLVIDRAGRIRGAFDLVVPADILAARELMLTCLAEDESTARAAADDSADDDAPSNKDPVTETSASKAQASTSPPYDG